MDADGSDARRGSLVVRRAVALLVAALGASGCVVTDERLPTLELEPLADGWRENLERPPGPRGDADVSGLEQFRWSRSDVHVGIRSYRSDGPAYFMLDLWNDGVGPVRASFLPAQAGGRISVTRGAVVHPAAWDDLADDGVLLIPPGASARVYVEDMPWRDAPQVGDAFACTAVFETDRGLIRCPVAFRVARRRLE